MTIEEIYSDLSAHMIKGLMVHDQMVSYYYFLNLKGYAKCHTYHYFCENKDYLKVKHYYLTHHQKLIREKQISDPKIIPTNWYAYERKDVDPTAKRNAVKTGLEKWIEWEKDTKALYQKMYVDLMSLGAIADANFISQFVNNVDEELAHAESLYIKKKNSDFNIDKILEDQDKKVKEYNKKIEEL